MYSIKLEVNGNIRHVNCLDYDYFCPVVTDNWLYRRYLQKYFPYDIMDRYRADIGDRDIPPLEVGPLDLQIQKDCMCKVEFGNYLPSLRFSDVLSSPFGEDQMKSDYYNALGQARYDAGLDHGLAPNYGLLLDRFVRPLENTIDRICKELLGGQFYLTMDSSDQDDFFYQWMFSGQMHQGVITLVDDQFMGFKIEFWDCYCVGLKEEMCSDDQNSMQMTLRLSPAITRNRKRKHIKSWRITELKEDAVVMNQRRDSPKRKGKIISCVYTNEQGRKIDHIRKNQSIYLMVTTSGYVGKYIDIDLSDDEIDYEYQGSYLENDLLQNMLVADHVMKIPLKTLGERKPKKTGGFLSLSFLDEHGEMITEVDKDQSLYLQIRTTGLKGKYINIDLSDDEIDYEYQGVHLTNDLLENVLVTDDIMKLPLKTLNTRNNG
ncbi:type VI secretion system tube protein TssD [Prolixibacteraceae bacterium]|nr:type VI secretion system tube protein TssD [Prolixibacteraceae bacterium]